MLFCQSVFSPGACETIFCQSSGVTYSAYKFTSGQSGQAIFPAFSSTGRFYAGIPDNKDTRRENIPFPFLAEEPQPEGKNGSAFMN